MRPGLLLPDDNLTSPAASSRHFDRFPLLQDDISTCPAAPGQHFDLSSCSRIEFQPIQLCPDRGFEQQSIYNRCFRLALHVNREPMMLDLAPPSLILGSTSAPPALHFSLLALYLAPLALHLAQPAPHIKAPPAHHSSPPALQLAPLVAWCSNWLQSHAGHWSDRWFSRCGFA